jgi:hypothetical protein
MRRNLWGNADSADNERNALFSTTDGHNFGYLRKRLRMAVWTRLNADRHS